MGRAAGAVDVLSVGRGEVQLDLGAEAGEELTGKGGRGTVGGVESDPQTGERPGSAGFADQPGQVAPSRRRIDGAIRSAPASRWL